MLSLNNLVPASIGGPNHDADIGLGANLLNQQKCILTVILMCLTIAWAKLKHHFFCWKADGTSFDDVLRNKFSERNGEGHFFTLTGACSSDPKNGMMTAKTFRQTNTSMWRSHHEYREDRLIFRGFPMAKLHIFLHVDPDQGIPQTPPRIT